MAFAPADGEATWGWMELPPLVLPVAEEEEEGAYDVPAVVAAAPLGESELR